MQGFVACDTSCFDLGRGRRCANYRSRLGVDLVMVLNPFDALWVEGGGLVGEWRERGRKCDSLGCG